MDVQELIENNKKLLSGFSPAKKKGRGEVNQANYIHQPRPAHSTDWKGNPRDVTFVQVYFPSKIPDFPTGVSVCLHNHDVFTQCTLEKYCHKVGFVPNEYDSPRFYRIWNYLYHPEIPPIVDVKFDLRF